MNLEIERELPALIADTGLMFSYPSALADLYHPAVEQVLLPELTFPTKTIKIRVATGYTGERKNKSLKYQVYNKITGFLKEEPTLNLTDNFIFDARQDTDANPAHVLRVAIVILLISETLSKHLGQPFKITVVLRARASNLSKQMYETLDIPVVCTDGKVFGDIIVNCEELIFQNCFQLSPSLLNFEFKGYQKNTPERVFIPRRGARSLINNDEVIELLEAKGFKTIYFEDLTVPEEWSIARNAKVAITVHGAGSYHLLFNRVSLDNIDSGEKFKFIDIFSPYFTLPSASRELAASVGGRWSAVRGQITPEGLQAIDFSGKQLNPLLSPVKDPFKVDLKCLEMALNYLEVD
ncbi:hypothetical protein C7293_10220 [filamentous cyanobacterium CCT1]|nr:hypothetical protein C7293_10220 [filamentous cyanobacterium CCT1]PSN80802.1 hypothetical protein C8B47_04550 [filamentous cyanobacterium CCP4]